MQSARRAIMRGNVVIAFDNVTKTQVLVRRRGTERKYWNWAVRNQVKPNIEE